MDDDRLERGAAVCPHVNREDHRCCTRFTLDRIEQAFSVCFGAFHVCPMYHQINGELTEAKRAKQRCAVITLTAHGSIVPLRATGT
ncbi:MAG: hypothetical protein ACYTGC_11060 [Planctomycetota bacterium]|jgi:hypothetical protein